MSWHKKNTMYWILTILFMSLTVLALFLWSTEGLSILIANFSLVPVRPRNES